MITIVAAAVIAVVTTVVVVIVASASDSSGRSHPAFFGIDTPSADVASVRTVTAHAGAAPSVVSVFVKLDSESFTVARLDAFRRAGLTPFVTVEPWSYKDSWGDSGLDQYSLAHIAAGDWDADLQRIADVIAAFHGQVYVRFAHEMNGWWYPWAVGQNGNTAAQYIAAWRHVVTLFRQRTGSLCRFVWSPAALTGSSKETPMAQMYPGDDWVDDVGLSAYGHSGDPAQTIEPSYQLITKLSPKPLILSETGASGADKETWIAKFGDYVESRPRIAGFVWFNTTPAIGASGDYRFDDNSADTQAFRASLQQILGGS